MTTDQVKAAMGIPEKIVNLGPKPIYLYKDLESDVPGREGGGRAVTQRQVSAAGAKAAETIAWTSDIVPPYRA